jgi:hypothetical protein
MAGQEPKRGRGRPIEHGIYSGERGGLIGSMFGNHEAGMLWGAIIFGFWCFFVVATVSAIFSLLLEIARNSRDTVRLLSAMNSKI